MLRKLVILLNIIVLSLFIVQFFTTPDIVFFLTANETSLIGKISDLFYMALLFFTPLLTIILFLRYKTTNEI